MPFVNGRALIREWDNSWLGQNTYPKSRLNCDRGGFTGYEPNRISLCFQADFQAIFKRGKPKSPTALQILKIPTKYFCLRFKNIIQKKVK